MIPQTVQTYWGLNDPRIALDPKSICNSLNIPLSINTALWEGGSLNSHGVYIHLTVKTFRNKFINISPILLQYLLLSIFKDIRNYQKMINKLALLSYTWIGLMNQSMAPKGIKNKDDFFIDVRD